MPKLSKANSGLKNVIFSTSWKKNTRGINPFLHYGQSAKLKPQKHQWCSFVYQFISLGSFLYNEEICAPHGYHSSSQIPSQPSYCALPTYVQLPVNPGNLKGSHPIYWPAVFLRVAHTFRHLVTVNMALSLHKVQWYFYWSHTSYPFIIMTRDIFLWC